MTLSKKSMASIHSFLRTVILLLFCGVLVAGAGQSAPAREPRIVNIYNFVRNSDYRLPNSEEVLYETTRQQIQLLKQANLPATWALQYDALINPRYQKLFKEQLGTQRRDRGLVGDSAATGRKSRPEMARAARVGSDRPTSVFLRATLRKNGANWWTSTWPISRRSLAAIPARSAHGILMKSPWLTWPGQYGIVASCNCKDQIGTDGYTLVGRLLEPGLLSQPPQCLYAGADQGGTD